MSTLEKLTELIDSLAQESVTRRNLLAIRGAMLAGYTEEWRLYAALSAFSREAIERLRS